MGKELSRAPWRMRVGVMNSGARASQSNWRSKIEASGPQIRVGRGQWSPTSSYSRFDSQVDKLW